MLEEEMRKDGDEDIETNDIGDVHRTGIGLGLDVQCWAGIGIGGDVDIGACGSGGGGGILCM
jgi:hypothetical protein